MALQGQQRRDELQVIGLIFHHHDRCHHACSGRLSARRRVNQKVLPLPSSESTPMVPPCSSTRRLESARPRPVPSYRRLALTSSCTNRSEEHTSELQSLAYLVCRLLLEKKKKYTKRNQL